MNITKVKDNYTIKETDPFIVCDSSTALAVTLKSAVGKGDIFYIKNIGSADVTVTASLPDLIDGAATKVLAQYEACLLLDLAVNIWMII